MGVIQSLRSADFHIPADDTSDAFHAIVELMSENQSGSSYDFAYMSRAYPESWDRLEDAMQAWRFPIETDEEGNVVNIEFWGEKTGDEHVLFERIAPFVETGSTIVMSVGAVGDRTRYTFTENSVRVERGL